MIKKFIFLLVLSVYSFTITAQSMYEVISSSNLYVRSAPEPQASIIGSVAAGHKIEVISVLNGWAEHFFNGQKGYSASRFLKRIETEVIGQEDSDTIKVLKVVYEVASSSRLNVRSDSSIQSSILGSLVPGYQIYGGEECGDWLKFDYEGSEAYVSLRFLRKFETVEYIIKEKEVVEEPVVIVEQPQPVDEEVKKRSNQYDFLRKDAVFNLSCIDSEILDLYLSLRTGFGYTGYTWDAGYVGGSFGAQVEVVTQLYWKNFCNLYMDASVGYYHRGAANLPMDYLNVGLTPLGYYFKNKNWRFTGNVGAYLGVPLTSLGYVNISAFDMGLSAGATVDYSLFSFGIEYNHGLINIATPDVRLYNWGVMAKISCKIISFNK